MESHSYSTFFAKKKCNFQRLLISALLISAHLILSGCATLQKDFPRTASYALEPGTEGSLANATNKITADLKPNESGFLMMARNDQAFRWRLILHNETLICTVVQFETTNDAGQALGCSRTSPSSAKRFELPNTNMKQG